MGDRALFFWGGALRRVLLLLFFVSFSFCLPTERDGVSFEPEWYYHQAPLLTMNYQFAHLRFVFEEDLYISHLRVCRRVLPVQRTCIPCNYSGPIDSDGKCDTNSSLSLDPNLPTCGGGCVDSYCRKGLPTFRFPGLSDNFQSNNLIVFHKFSHEDNNKGFSVKIVAQNGGYVTVFLLTEPVLHDRYVLGLIVTRFQNEIVVCPSDPRLQNYTSFFIAVSSFENKYFVEYEYSISVLEDESHYFLSEIKPFTVEEKPNGVFLSANHNIVDSSFSIQKSELLQYGAFTRMIFSFPFVDQDCFLASISTENSKLSELMLFVGVVEQAKFLEILDSEDLSQMDLLASQHARPAYISSGGNLFTVCPLTPVPSDTVLFIIFLDGPNWRSFDLYLRNVTGHPNIESTPIAELGLLEFREEVGGSHYMECPCLENETDCSADPPRDLGLETWSLLADELSPPDQVDFIGNLTLFDNNSFHFHCFPRFGYNFSQSCEIMRVVPTLGNITLNPLFFPMPDVVRAYRIFQFDDSILPETNQSRISNVITLVVQLKTHYQTTLTAIHIDRFRRCRINFLMPSRLHTKSFRPPSYKPIEVNKMFQKEMECTHDGITLTYDQTREQAAALVASTSFEHEFDGFESVLSRGRFYYISNLFVTLGNQGCFSRIWDFYESGPITRETRTDYCVVYDPLDPCCNYTMDWGEICCSSTSSERVELEIDRVMPLTPNKSKIQAECFDPDCVEIIAEDYRYDLLEQVEVGRCANFNSEIFFSRDAIRECEVKWYGEGLTTGYYCETKKDCEKFGDNISCDLVNHRCSSVAQQLEDGFLTCFVDSLIPILRSALISIIQELDGGEFFMTTEELVSRIRNIIDIEMVISPDGITAPCQDRWVLEFGAPSNQTCFSCEGVGCRFWNTCKYPLECNELDRNCLSFFAYDRIQEICNSSLFCNWDKEITDPEICEAEEEMCMFCLNETNCVLPPIPVTSQSECEETTICVLSDGSYLFDLSDEECREIDVRPCLLTGTCGHCIDPDNIFLVVKETADLVRLSTPERVCVFPMRPHNTPGCSHIRGSENYDFVARRGCIAAFTCERPSICTFISSEECESANGHWVNIPFNEEDCVGEGEIFCAQPFSYPNQVAHPSKIGCENCSESPESVGEWENHKNLSGTPYKMEWREPKMVAEYVEARGLDYSSFDFLVAQMENVVNTWVYSQSFFCYFQINTPYLWYLSNQCLVPLDEHLEVDTINISSVGLVEVSETEFANSTIGIWCPGTNLSVMFFNGELLTFTNDTELLTCVPGYIFNVFRSEFVGKPPQKPVTVFGDPNTVDPDSVRNEHGASVGVIVGDGIFVSPSTDFTLTRDMSMLIYFRVSEHDAKSDNKKYTVLDLGIEVLDPSQKKNPGVLEVRPDPSLESASHTTATNVSIVRGQWLGVNLSAYLFEDGETRSAYIFPILRMEEWQTQKEGSILTDGETVMLYVFSGLYGIAFIIVFVILCIVTLLIFTKSNVLMLTFGAVVLLLRAIYLGLYAGEYLQDVSVPSIIFVELPCFLYLSMASVIVMSFHYSYQTFKGGDEKIMNRTSWKLFFLSQGVLYIIFAIVVVLMQELPSESVTSECFARLVDYQRDTTIDIIRFAYHLFSLCVGCIIMAMVGMLGSKLSKMAGSRKIIQFSAIVVIGLFTSNLLWVIYSGLRGSSAYFVIPLFLTETIPIGAIAILVCPKRDLRRLYHARTATLSSLTSS